MHRTLEGAKGAVFAEEEIIVDRGVRDWVVVVAKGALYTELMEFLPSSCNFVTTAERRCARE